MHDFIDLGVSCEMNSYTGEAAATKKTFPCLYITSEDPIEFGDTGTASIQYKVVERAEKNRDGKTEHRYELEVRKIAPTDEEMDGDDEGEDVMPMKRKPKALKQSFGDALDKARASRYSEG